MSHIPTPIRAALGLAATAVAEARKLPEILPQLPVTAVSTAMQASLRVQQHIATFAARGDEVISQLRGTSADPPSWATFDDAPDAGRPTAAFDRAASEPANLEDTGSVEPGSSEPAHSIDTEAAVSGEPSIPIDQQAAENAAPADNSPAPQEAPPTQKAAPAKKAAKALPDKAAKKPPAKAAPPKAPAKKAPAKKAVKKSEPLVEAARKADPSSGPNPSTMAAEILQAHSGESPAAQ
jgi:hypothetical protein